MNISEVLVQPQAMAWLPWAVQYFFYIGSAYAAAILFLIALLFEKHTSHRLRAAFVLTLAIGAIVGPLALTGDLHQPGRAWHFYAHITPWSWMSLGSLFLPVFSGLAVITAWLYLRQDLINLRDQPGKVLPLISKLSLGDWALSRRAMLMVSAITVLSGITIAVYTGAEIAVVKSRSLWHQPASPILWFVTAFMGSVGFALLIWLLLPSQSKTLTSGDTNLLKKSVVTSGVLTLILLPIWASNNSAFSLYSSEQWMHNIALLTFVILGSITFAFMTMRDTKSSTTSRIHRVMGSLCLSLITLASAWLIRWFTIMEVQTIAKFDAGLYPYQLTMDGNGWIGIIGMLGLWLALALLASELIQPKRNSEVTPTSLTLTER
ncbi:MULTISPECIES: NrfD/PsrC family molybdoenzyme membrane anchor subunit [unclassified Vibrio]|uniref:NrfD/PsrC family molybdoenzyme membrane anchor subunit n=1 Tax=unclassified Vibrio TaxID=2614977 RepID=UPI002964E990|nr:MULTISPECIES: NrfD/PsrC family molybdoenzyme membrane anchor subunit [unclassified Vibrio]MDW2273979.1 NrfD/PsrC family molybdoenzyme membrane anchor subunit [Vibrio sp. 1074]MDW2285275.1 NrfD/PsrC family molybdoenzyme membrane anchor subunit [Vibrio sp. 1562]MDW3121471.1 NrfD/PsrC family molybdoenzyme membrane anchor subunit [Vibrio sp. 1974]